MTAGKHFNRKEIFQRKTNTEEIEHETDQEISRKGLKGSKFNLVHFTLPIHVMSTYTQIIYQIVFSTKNREHTLSKDNRPKLFEYIIRILLNNKCHVYCINGVDDHIHILTHLHPTVALASLVKDIKLASSAFIKEKGLFKNFGGWQEGYGAFTYSMNEKQFLIKYVRSQEQHHKKILSKEEYIQLLNENGVEFDERYLL